MEFFGIGMPEMIVIMVIAIIVLGPDKIPGVIQQVGKVIRDFRRFTSEMTKEFDEATGGIRDEFRTITTDLKSELAATQADLKSQLDITGMFNEALNGKPVTETMDLSTLAGAAATTDTLVPAEAAPLPAAESAPAPAVALVEPEPPPVLTVSTPYAEALAAAPNGNGTNGNGGHDATPAPPRRATKADPFADLVMLSGRAPAAATEPEITTFVPEPAPLEPAPFALAADATPAVSEPAIFTDAPVATIAPPVEAPAVTIAPVRAKKVGGSVAGSKYGRKKSA